VGTAGVVSYNVRLRNARNHAQDSVGRMILAVDTMLREVGEEQLAYEPRMEEKRRALLEKARAIYREVPQEYRDDPRLRESAAMASRGLGNVLRLLGEHDQAAVAYREAIDLFERLEPERRGRAEVRLALADCYNFLGEALREGGDRAAARGPYHHALALLDGLIAESAEPGYRQDRARTLYNVGLLLRETGDPAGAKEKLEQAVAVLGELPASAPTRQHLARAQLNLGTVLHDLQQFEPALAHFGEARTILMDLARRDPEVADYRHELALVHNNRGNLLGNRQKARQARRRPAGLLDRLSATWTDYRGWREALDEHEEARSHFRVLVRDFPRVPKYRAELANTHNSLGRVYLELNDLSGTEREWGEAQRLLDELTAGPHAQSAYRLELGQLLGNLGLVAFRRDRKPEAARLFERAAELLEEASRQMSGHPDLGRLLCTQYQRLAFTHLELGSPREARRAARKLGNADAATPRDVYNAACFLGRCAKATMGELRRECAAEALAMLRNARDLGFRAARLPEEDAFDALAHEEEFRRLRREITKL
jgi:tetratricopeptide (TPR) repeat protein